MSFTGNLKIGVTRNTQIPTRWIDQGATKGCDFVYYTKSIFSWCN